MISYREHYGQDIDGNRGVVRYEHELEDSDSADILDILKSDITDEEYDSTFTVELFSDMTGDGVEFDIVISDYMTEQEYLDAIKE